MTPPRWWASSMTNWVSPIAYRREHCGDTASSRRLRCLVTGFTEEQVVERNYRCSKGPLPGVGLAMRDDFGDEPRRSPTHNGTDEAPRLLT